MLLIKIIRIIPIIIFFALILTFFSQNCIAQEAPLDTMTEIEPKIEYNEMFPENLGDINLNLKEEDKHKLRDKPPEINMDEVIKLTPEEQEFKNALDIQKGNEIEDIKKLWDATLERNPVIRFAIEKVTSPPKQRKAASSLMARSIATMMQGAAIVPSIFGMGAASEYSSVLGGQLISKMFARKFVPEPGMPSITEPELIQLSSLIENLQEQLIRDYYNYKSSLESLLLEKQNMISQENNYKKALASKDQTSIIITSALYDKSKQSELRVKQQAKLYRVQLERLAGIEAVSKLNLTIPEEVLKAKENLENTGTDSNTVAPSTKSNSNEALNPGETLNESK